MPMAKRRGSSTGTRQRQVAAALAGSALLHAALLAMTGLVAPRFHGPFAEPAVEPAIVPVILAPRRPIAAPATQPRLALHRPKTRDAPATVAPLVTRDAEALPAAPPTPAATPPALAPDLRRALGRNTVGCEALTGTARDDCLDRLGRATPDVPYTPGLGLSRQKRADLDAAAAKVDARRRYRLAPSVGTAKSLPADYDGEPYTSGVGARDPYGKPPHTSGRAARRLERLPP